MINSKILYIKNKSLFLVHTAHTLILPSRHNMPTSPIKTSEASHLSQQENITFFTSMHSNDLLLYYVRAPKSIILLAPEP